MNDGPELVIGLVAAAGTDLARVSVALNDSLSRVKYSLRQIRLSQLLHEVPALGVDLPERPEDDRYNAHMNAGNLLRERLNCKDALALLAIGAIRDVRAETAGEATRPAGAGVTGHPQGFRGRLGKLTTLG